MRLAFAGVEVVEPLLQQGCGLLADSLILALLGDGRAAAAQFEVGEVDSFCQFVQIAGVGRPVGFLLGVVQEGIEAQFLTVVHATFFHQGQPAVHVLLVERHVACGVFRHELARIVAPDAAELHPDGCLTHLGDECFGMLGCVDESRAEGVSDVAHEYLGQLLVRGESLGFAVEKDFSYFVALVALARFAQHL